MAAVSDFGGRYDENTVKRIMEPGCPLGVDESEEDTDEFYRWLHDEVGF